MIEVPHNLAIEQAVLGALLVNNNLFDQISHILKADDFFEPVHQQIYKSMIVRLMSGKIADALSLMSTMKQMQVNPSYLIQLTENSNSLINIKDYADILVELAQKRALIEISGFINESVKTNQELSFIRDKLETFVFETGHRQIKNSTLSFFNAANNSMDEIKKLMELQSSPGVATGFKQLDQIIGTMKAGELCILAGRPSGGKTAFATRIAINVSLQKISVLFVSLEMSSNQICYRIISSISGVHLTELLEAQLSQRTLKDCLSAINQFRDLPLFIQDSSMISLIHLRTLIAQMVRKNRIKLVVIDYLQLLDAGGKNFNVEQEISKISRFLKLLAKEFSIVIFALSQLSREVEKREKVVPKLSDLRYSGSIEQDADRVMFLYHENDNVFLKVAKNRNGPLTVIQFGYEKNTTTFYELP